MVRPSMKTLKLFLFLALYCQAELIPPDRLTDWTPGTTTGITGGLLARLAGYTDDLDIYTNVLDHGLDPTGVVDCYAAAQSLANSHPYLYFPAGTYKMSQPLTSPHSLDGASIRGDGMGLTIIKGPLVTYQGSDYLWPTTPTAITEGLVTGSTSITVTDASDMVVGQLLRIEFEDERDDTRIAAGSIPVFGVGATDGAHGLRKQIVRITNKSGSVLTFNPPIIQGAETGLGGTCQTALLQVDNANVFDLTIDLIDSENAYGIQLNNNWQFFAYQVEIKNTKNYGIDCGTGSLQCEIRRCYIHDRKVGGSNGAGLLMNQASSFLVEDNIFYKLAPSLEINSGSCGNVVAYNYFENPYYDHGGGVYYFDIAMDLNHGPWNSYNLYEGNYTTSAIWDCYFGGGSRDTFFRNWVHSTYQAEDQVAGYTVAPKRFSFELNFVGNVLGKSGLFGVGFSWGQPNIGNSNSDGTSEFFAGDFPIDWKMTGTLTTRTDNTHGVITLISGSMRDTQGGIAIMSDGAGYAQGLSTITTLTGVSVVNGANTVYAGGTFSFTAAGGTLPSASTVLTFFAHTYGFQEVNNDVQNTATEKGNYTFASDGSAGSMSSLGGDTLPDSLYDTKANIESRIGAPLTLVDPTNPNGLTFTQLPAGYRFINGSEPGGTPSGGSTTISGSGTTTISGSGSTTIQSVSPLSIISPSTGRSRSFRRRRKVLT